MVLIKISSDLLRNLHLRWKILNTDMTRTSFFIKNLNLGKLILKVEFDWIYLKISTRANLKVLNTNLTSIFYYYVFER